MFSNNSNSATVFAQMKIIVAGCPKTGTKSVNAALKRLGFSVFDFVEHLYCLEEEWGAVFSQGWDEDTFRKMYEDVDAAVDLPASLFWEQIHEAFPDAKVRFVSYSIRAPLYKLIRVYSSC